MTRTPHFITIRRMIRTFLRRWWITNRLYHVNRKGSPVWIDEEDFLTWLLGYEVAKTKHPEWHYKGFFQQSNISFFILSKLIDKKKNRTEKESDVRNIIAECEKVEYIERNQDEQHIMVGTKGMEIYSVSYILYLFLHNTYIEHFIKYFIIPALLLTTTWSQIKEIIIGALKVLFPNGIQ